MRAPLLAVVAILGLTTAAHCDDKPPALAHVLASGATLSDEGSEHGLRTYMARSADHFMVFDLAPDGQAIVSGVLLQVPLAQLLSASGSRITELPRSHGLRAFFLRNGPQFQVFYATPDEQRVIPGIMWDASGRNLTKQQIAGIPGTSPTVELRDGPAPAGEPSDDRRPVANAVVQLQAIASTTAGPTGSDGAPSAWMFVDPQCQFSVRAMQELRPAIDAGKLRLAVVPLSILDREDQGLSTARALAMVGKPATEMVADWEAGDLAGPPAAIATGMLQTNMAAARTLDLKGTPTFFWRRKDGTVGRFDGVPSSPEALIRAIGADA